MLVAKETRKLTENQEVSYALSTRDIQKFTDHFLSFEADEDIQTLQLALDMNVLSFFETKEEVDTIKSRIESAFGSKVFDGEAIGIVGDLDGDTPNE